MQNLMEHMIMPEKHLLMVDKHMELGGGEEEFHTFFELNMWYHKLVSKFGQMLLLHHEGHHEAIHHYLKCIMHFMKAIECKCNETQSPDKKQDLLIMKHKIKILKHKLIKIFGLEKLSPCNF